MEDTTQVGYREWIDVPDFQSEKVGSIIKSSRLFGVEIECIPHNVGYGNGLTSEVCIVANAMGPSLGIGSDAGGVELKTPKLSMVKGENYITKLCELLDNKRFSVTENCGLHVHLDGGTQFMETNTNTYTVKTVALRKLMAFYIAYEDVIQSFLPNSRRNKQWCNPIKRQFSLEKVLESLPQIDLEKLWYKNMSTPQINITKMSKGGGQRPGINFSPLFGMNHLEIRYHSGTINARKILEWVNLHQTIMDHAANDNFYIDSRVTTIPSLEEKTWTFFQQLQLPLSSVEYFLARQELFKKKVEFAPYDKKEMLKLIKSDNEVLV